MDNKVKLIAVASVVAVMASGCSGYRGSSQNVNNNVDASGAAVGAVDNATASSGSSQVAGSGQVSSQRATTCTPCATPAPKNTYTYNPAPKKTYTRPAPKAAGQHNQQYYLDRWKRQQAQQNNATKTTTYNGYGTGGYNANAGAGNTTYYDYSSAGQATKTPAPVINTNVSASNKSIYTGSYQQKTYQPYQPTTYAGGSAATTNTTTTYAATTSGGGSGSTYTVRKGDTVFEIMRQTGVYWKDIIKLNNLQAPAYNINPGQIIRLK